MRSYSAFILMIILFSSCSKQNSVVSENLLQKRKYRRGFHVEAFAHKRNPVTGIRDIPAAREENFNRTDTTPCMALEQVMADGTVSAPATPEILKPAGDERMVTGRRSLKVVQRLLAKDEDVAAQPARPGNDSDPYELAGILAMVFGGANLLLLWIVPFLGVVLAVLAIFFGVKAQKSTEPATRILGILGMALGIISLMVALIWTIYIALLFF